MFYYVPFEKEEINQGVMGEVGEAYSGHLVGIFFRFYSGFDFLSWTRIAVSDIGAMKDYILPKTSSHLFKCGQGGDNIDDSWSPLLFVFLDHIIQENHKVVFEVMTIGYNQTDVSGVFVYQK